MNLSLISLPGYTVSADLHTPRSDGWDRIREQRAEHMANARWWKRRYQEWGSPMALAWFRAEANSHRICSRQLRQYEIGSAAR